MYHSGFFLKLADDNVKIKNPKGVFEKIDFFSFFLMRKRLSSGQKWFLRPYFPLIRSMFVFSSGLIFTFRALEIKRFTMDDFFLLMHLPGPNDELKSRKIIVFLLSGFPMREVYDVVA